MPSEHSRCPLACLSPVLSCSTLSLSSSAPSTPPATDDLALRPEPSRHVDYFSHPWTTRDVSSAWRQVTSEKHAYHNARRLENAAWRSWAKHIHSLPTVSPHTLNWLKDHDVTWLYGPLFSPGKRFDPEPAFVVRQFRRPKPILKKSFAALGLRQYASATNLAATALLDRRPSADSLAPSDLASTLTSGSQTPSPRKHIHFNDRVEQCIALDCKDDHNTIIAKLPSTRLKDIHSPETPRPRLAFFEDHPWYAEEDHQPDPLVDMDSQDYPAALFQDHPAALFQDFPVEWIDIDEDPPIGWIESAFDVISTVKEIVTVLWNIRRA